jgi:phage shock protein A
MVNKLKLWPFLVAFLVLVGCGEDGTATIDVLKNRLTNQIQDMVGKGDIAVQKYQNKIAQVKNNLIKVKVSRKTFEQKLQAKQNSVAAMEKSGGSPEKVTILKSTVQEMENFLAQIQQAEAKMETTLKKLIENLDLVKLKVAAMEAKRDMLDAMQSIQQYTTFEGEVDALGGEMDSTLEDMQKEIYAIEAELEIENLLSEMKEL